MHADASSETIVALGSRPRLAAGVARFGTELWGRDLDRNARYLRWKYRRNPCLVALDGDEILGMRGAFGMRWRRGTREADVYGAADALVRADRRRHGIFRRMTEALLSSFGPLTPPFINLSSWVTSAAGYVRLGWQVAGSWQVAHRWLSPGRRDTLSPGRRGEPTPFAVLDRAGAAASAGIRVRRRPDPALMEAIVGRTDDGTRLGPVRDRRFFAWRYGNPLVQYRFLYLHDRAYMVLQFPLRSSRARINVVELEATTLDDKVTLLEVAMAAGDFSSLAIWSAGYSARERTTLARLGFQLVDHASAHLVNLYCPPILVRPGAAFLRRIPPLTQWRLPGIAADHF